MLLGLNVFLIVFILKKHFCGSKYFQKIQTRPILAIFFLPNEVRQEVTLKINLGLIHFYNL